MINFSLNKYFNEVVLPCLFVTSLSCLLPIVVKVIAGNDLVFLDCLCFISIF